MFCDSEERHRLVETLEQIMRFRETPSGIIYLASMCLGALE